MHGILNINKPAGMSSRRAVDIVERLMRPIKSGHAGTLDPLADGVLLVCIGPASRWIEYLQQLPKRYIATFSLGHTSPTDDLEGEVVELLDAPQPTLEEIAAASQKFLGTIDQRPPAFSAVKVAGRRAYDLARKGKTPEIRPRPVTIHTIAIAAYEYPKLVLDISCGSGTYIRSLGRDLAESLGTAAVMTALTRMSIGRFTIESAVDPCELTPDNWRERVIPTSAALEHLPRLTLSLDEVNALQCGKTAPRQQSEAMAADAQFAAFDPAGELIGVVRFNEDGRLCTVRNMPTEQGGG
jgi:tRNA pseudouridine55 synthase